MRVDPSQEATATRTASNGSLLVLLLLTALAYLNSFAGTWQFDDFAVLVHDPRVQTVADWWQSLPHIRPLFKLSVAVNHALGAGLAGFHALNLLWHLINVVLVYSVFRQLIATHSQAPLPTGAALLIAAVFALHPAQTEAVTYLSGRSVAMASTGILLAVWSGLRGRQRQQKRWFVLAAMALLFAVGSRETAIVTPLLMAWVTLSKAGCAVAPTAATDERTSPPVRGAATPARVLFACATVLALLALMLCLPRYRELLWLALQWPGAAQLLATQAQAIVHLLLLAAGIAPVNADPALLISPVASLRGIASALVFLFIGVVAWRQRQRKPLFALGVGWAAIVWLPTHTVLLRFDPVNDRQLYLALPGLLLALTAVLPVPQWLRRFHLAFLLLVAMLLAWSTWQHNNVYRSEVLFWQDVTQKAPHNARGWNNLGVAYANQGELNDAEQAFVRALAERQDYVQAAVNLKLLRAGQWRSEGE